MSWRVGMAIAHQQITEQLVLQSGNNLFTRVGVRITALIPLLFLLAGAIYAQADLPQTEGDPAALVISGVNDTTVFGCGRSIRITGVVKHGAIAFGGDVLVEGIVEGDVASIGGSVIQSAGARIEGDVIVVGGAYRHIDATPERGPSSMTMMYAGYEQELRDLMRNPASLLTPRWSSGYLGMRILSVLFWFIVSLALTAAMPGAVSRGVARLQLTSLRVALIGLVGAFVIAVGIPSSLWLLPAPLSVLVGVMALLLLVVAGLFGRVVIYAATGRWLQRRYLQSSKNSEAVALLVGTTFWITLTSLPYIWPVTVAVVLILSLGLALTARYRVGWGRT
jgi:hypothetical protein